MILCRFSSDRSCATSCDPTNKPAVATPTPRSGVKSGQNPRPVSSSVSRKVFPEESFFSTYCQERAIHIISSTAHHPKITVCLSVSPSVCLSCLFICLSVLFVYLSVCLSICLSKSVRYCQFTPCIVSLGMQLAYNECVGGSSPCLSPSLFASLNFYSDCTVGQNCIVSFG